MNERKLQRAEAIQLSKKKEWQRRRHLGIKKQRNVMAVEDLDCGEFEELFPQKPLQTLYIMKRLIGGDNSDNGFDPREFDEYEDWDYSFGEDDEAFEDETTEN